MVLVFIKLVILALSQAESALIDFHHFRPILFINPCTRVDTITLERNLGFESNVLSL